MNVNVTVLIKKLVPDQAEDEDSIDYVPRKLGTTTFSAKWEDKVKKL